MVTKFKKIYIDINIYISEYNIIMYIMTLDLHIDKMA